MDYAASATTRSRRSRSIRLLARGTRHKRAGGILFASNSYATSPSAARISSSQGRIRRRGVRPICIA
jgi:hypothetical protein